MKYGKIFKAYFKSVYPINITMDSIFNGKNRVSQLPHKQLIAICRNLRNRLHVEIPSDYMRKKHEELVKITYKGMKAHSDSENR